MGPTTGRDLLLEAKRLVLEALRSHGVMTAVQIERATGLYLDVPHHRGYIVWTLLQNLLLEGSIVKAGRHYRLADPT